MKRKSKKKKNWISNNSEFTSRLNKIVASCVPEVIVKSVPRGAGDRRKRGEGEGRRFHELSSRAVVVSFPLRFHFSDQFFQELNGAGKGRGRERGWEGIGEIRALTNSPRVSWVVVAGNGFLGIPSRFARNSTRERCRRVDRIVYLWPTSPCLSF